MNSRVLRFAFALTAEVLLLAALQWFDDWTLEEMPAKFVGVALLCGIAYLIAVGRFPLHLGFRAQRILFWTVVVGLRLIALPLEPGNDLWRYQWEGKIQQAGFNPYLNPPDDPRLEALRAEFPAWYKISHRDFRPIHPPGAELLFAGLSLGSDSPLLYKIVFAAADVATIAVLLRLRRGAKRYADTAWYAWNPLVVYSFAGAAHFDSVMILPIVAGILFLVRFQSETDPRRKWWLALGAAALFGIAISIKPVAALLLVCAAFALGYRAVTLIVSVVIPVLFSFLYGFPKITIWKPLFRFGHVTRLNDLFWWVIEETAWPNLHQRNYSYDVVLLIAVVLVSLLFFRNWKRGMLWALGTALILSPLLHPWYCTWILPLATWRRTYAWHVLSVTLFAYYLFWNERLFALPWHSEPWLRALIAVPPLVAGLLLGLRQRRSLEIVRLPDAGKPR